jgi:two-component Ni(II)/redox sensor kinase NrsS
MSAIRNPAPGLLWRSRLRLASLALLVMGLILYGAGFTMARLLLQEQEAALRRELQTVAGTLHDSLKLSLPPTATASAALSAVLPGLCLVDLPCPMPDALIERHAISATDPARFSCVSSVPLAGCSPPPPPLQDRPGRAPARCGRSAAYLAENDG